MDEREHANPGVVNGSVEQAEALRESLTSRERERVETTVTELLDLLGRTHTMVVLSKFAFADGPLRFSEIESATGVPPNTLTTRLQELTGAGLLDRRPFDEVPPRVEYEATSRLKALYPVFGHLHRWALDNEIRTPK